MSQLFTIKLQGVLRKPFGWKRYAWKKMEDRDKERLMAAVEVFWCWAWLRDASLDRFLGV